MIIANEYIKLYGEEYFLDLILTKYGDGNNALIVNSTFEPFGKLSVNIPEQAHRLGPYDFFVKTWGENEAWYPAFYKYFDTLDWTVPCGFANAFVWRLKKEYADKIEENKKEK